MMKSGKAFPLKLWGTVILLVCLLATTGLVGAQGGGGAVQSGAPTVVSYQGQVLVDGAPYTGAGYFKFAVVDRAGTTTYWSNDGTSAGGSEPDSAVTLTVSGGLFTVLLGDTTLPNMTALPAAAFDGTDRALRVWFSTDGVTFTQLAPDRQIAAVPYALQAEAAAYAAAADYAAAAGDADTLDGLHADAFAAATHNHDETYVNEGQADSITSAMIVNATIALADLGQNGCTSGQLLKWDGTAWTCAGDTGVTNHGDLTGLGDDDHPQYFNLGQSETVTGIPAFDGGTSGTNAPFTVDSTYGVTNLNADLLDGLHANELAYWGLAGNSGTTPGTQFIGTTDNQALEVKVNNTRALRLEPGDSPNLIGGYSGNWVAAGTFGAVIAGGGQSGNLNRVVDHMGVVGGGQNNQAGSDNGSVGDNTFGTVAGGANNTASGTLSAIGGGSTNTASGSYSTISGGRSNAASSNYAFVGGGYGNLANGPDYGPSVVVGGQYNTATGDYAFIGGGANNQVTAGVYSAVAAGANNLIPNTGWANFIGGGYGNVISGTASYASIGGVRQNTINDGYATIAGGRGNTASGGYATVAGGWGNTASGPGSAVTGGFSTNASHYGEQAHASGQFAAAGDAQASVYVLRRQYAMAAGTWHDLFLDGNSTSQRLTIAAGRTVTFDILISGRTEAGESAGYRIQGVIENVGGTTALVGTPVVTVLGEDDAAWNVQVLASDTLDALLPQVQGNGETIRWVATVNTTEVSW